MKKEEKKMDTFIKFFIILATINLALLVAIVFYTSRLESAITKINRNFEIFQEAVPYDSARDLRIDRELAGNFNNFK